MGKLKDLQLVNLKIKKLQEKLSSLRDVLYSTFLSRTRWQNRVPEDNVSITLKYNNGKKEYVGYAPRDAGSKLLRRFNKLEFIIRERETQRENLLNQRPRRQEIIRKEKEFALKVRQERGEKIRFLRSLGPEIRKFVKNNRITCFGMYIVFGFNDSICRNRRIPTTKDEMYLLAGLKDNDMAGWLAYTDLLQEIGIEDLSNHIRNHIKNKK